MVPQRAFFALNELFQVDPRDINCGDCYLWAAIAKELFPHAELYTIELSAGDHAFIKLDGLFYDAQNPEGVRRWQALEYIRTLHLDNNPIKITKSPYAQAAEQFAQDWYMEGDHELIFSMAQSVLEQLRFEALQYG